MGDDTAEARAAHAAGDWAAARAALERAAASGPLPADDLARLATAQWWLGDQAASMATAEAVYRARLAAGAVEEAALGATELALLWFAAGDLAVASGWLGRARRLRAGRPSARVDGYVAYVAFGYRFEADSDPDAAARASDELRALAGRFDDDPALGCFALVAAGLRAASGGDVEGGFDLLDQAMLPVVAGQVGPLWSGDVYCSVVHLCGELADLTRMRSWTDAMERWASPLSRRFMFTGVARVHRLQLQAAEGRWSAVEQELGPQSGRLTGAHGWVAGEGYRTLGDVRRLRGDVRGAEEAYTRARGLGIDPQPGAALLLAAAGRPDAAMTALRAALSAARPLERSRTLPAVVEVALGLGDLPAARAAAAELEDVAAAFPGPGLRAAADTAAARVLLADRRWDEASTRLARAVRTYRAQRFRYATAQVHELTAAALRGRGEHDRAAAEEATALAVYRDLGAGPDADRLARGAAAPGGLTAREAEVLACAASGASNREIADTLVISTKTVGRHLANIYLKLGVTSRTAAAGWARDHGVAPRTAAPGTPAPSAAALSGRLHDPPDAAPPRRP